MTFDVNDVYVVDEQIGVLEVHDGDVVTVLEPSADTVHIVTTELLTVLEPVADVVQLVTPDLIGPPGPPGPPGPQGLKGDPGPQGPFAPTFEQHFASAAYTWVIPHNMDVYPVTNTYDLDGNEISGDVHMPDRNTVVVTFAVPVAGTARLKA